MSKSLLSKEQLDEFLQNGVVVIENVLSLEEVTLMRNSIHDKLLQAGIDHHAIIEGTQDPPAGVRMKGETSRIFYNKQKMNIHLREDIYQTFKDIILNGTTQFEECNEKFDDVLPYIDRICWRLPDHILEEGGLNLHLDRNPWNQFLASKYRPVQGFISLTDQYGSESGGLKVVKGFHKKINEYFKQSYNETEAKSTGAFYRLHDKSHTKLQSELQQIDAPAGSLVIWSNSLPHATCQKLTSFDSREVLYLSYLPNIEINKKYWREQSVNFLNNLAPPSYNDGNPVDRDYDVNDLNEFQRKMMGIN